MLVEWFLIHACAISDYFHDIWSFFVLIKFNFPFSSRWCVSPQRIRKDTGRKRRWPIRSTSRTSESGLAASTSGHVTSARKLANIAMTSTARAFSARGMALHVPASWRVRNPGGTLHSLLPPRVRCVSALKYSVLMLMFVSECIYLCIHSKCHNFSYHEVI